MNFDAVMNYEYFFLTEFNEKVKSTLTSIKKTTKAPNSIESTLRSVEALFNSSNKNANRSEKTKSVHVNNFEELAKSQESSSKISSSSKNSKVIIQDRIVSRQQPWNLVQHTDRNGITHIEVGVF